MKELFERVALRVRAWSANWRGKDSRTDESSARKALRASLDRLLVRACLVALLLLLAVFALSSFTRYLVNDDYQTLYTAWLQSEGKVPGRDYFLTSFYLLVDLVAPLYHIAPGTWLPLFASRLGFTALLVLVAWLLWRVGTRPFDGATGWLAPVLALATASMLHRGLDLRPDLITTALWLGIVVCLLSPQPTRPRVAMLAGALLALCFLNRFKAAIAGPLLAPAYLVACWDGRLRTSARTVARLAIQAALGAALVLGAYAAYLALSGNLLRFLDTTGRLMREMGQFARSAEGTRGRTVLASLHADPLFWSLCAMGVAMRAAHARRYTLRDNVLAASVLLLGTVSVMTNPAYYVYNLVTLQPLVAPFAAYPVALGLGRLIRFGRPALTIFGAVAAVAAPVLAQAGLLLTLATRPSNTHQLALAEFIQHHTAPDAAVFALEGVGLYRPSTYHWRLSWILTSRYARGEMDFARELRETRPELVVLSYRLPGWLLPQDRHYLDTHFAALSPLVLAPGFDTFGVVGEHSFELLAGGRYLLETLGEGTCALDGMLAPRRGTSVLVPGPHRLLATDARCRLVRHFPPEALALLDNPENLPYFTPPELDMPAPIGIVRRAQ